MLAQQEPHLSLACWVPWNNSDSLSFTFFTCKKNTLELADPWSPFQQFLGECTPFIRQICMASTFLVLIFNPSTWLMFCWRNMPYSPHKLRADCKDKHVPFSFVFSHTSSTAVTQRMLTNCVQTGLGFLTHNLRGNSTDCCFLGLWNPPMDMDLVLMKGGVSCLMAGRDRKVDSNGACLLHWLGAKHPAIFICILNGG